MKQTFFLATIFILIVIIANLSVSLYSLWSKKDLMTQTRQKLLQEQQEQGVLKRELQQVSSPLFVEEQARDKLFMGKPGDVVVFLPNATPSASKKTSELAKPVWQQWWDLFF